MADPMAFLRVPREERRRTPAQRLRDWREVHLALPDGGCERQAERCMGCGIPFCHEVCPLGNLIPEWNELVARGAWQRAIERLHATNNFPEFTGTLCPAPCEDGCVLAINCRAGHDQADRAADHRPGVAGGLDHAVPAGGADRPGGGRGRAPDRPGWPRPSSSPG